MLVFAYLILIYSNTIFYTIILIGIVLILVGKLYFFSYISTLIRLLTIAVYIGAVIIIIGYVCAICHNELRTKFNLGNLLLITIPVIVVYLGTGIVETQNVRERMTGIFLFRTMGAVFFVLLVVMLILTLLVRTALLVSPKGPFRSI